MKYVIKIYLDDGRIFKYEVESVEKVREHASAIINGGYRHNINKIEMRKLKVTTKTAIALSTLLCVVLSSCRERVKVVELQEIKVDTTYIYKIERTDDGKNFYDIERRTQKLNAGDYIKIVR